MKKERPIRWSRRPTSKGDLSLAKVLEQQEQVHRRVIEVVEHAQAPDDGVAEILVLEACEQLVEHRLATWRRGATDEIELQLSSGEVFAFRESGITRV